MPNLPGPQAPDPTHSINEHNIPEALLEREALPHLIPAEPLFSFFSI